MSSMSSQTYRGGTAPDAAAPSESLGAASGHSGAAASNATGRSTGTNHKGCLKFVLISYKDPESQQISYTYWPALVFPTYFQLQVFLRDNSGGGILAQVMREWKGQADTRYGNASVDGAPFTFPGYEVVMEGWKNGGWYAPDERTDQLCLLIGTSLPSTVTRSWPILPSNRMPTHLRTARMAPAAPFTTEWCNNFRYRKKGDLTFLAALEMAERCNEHGFDSLAPMLSFTSPPDVCNGDGARTTSMPADQQPQQRLASNRTSAPAQDYDAHAAHAQTAPSPDADDDMSVLNVDANGEYNIPTPSRNRPTPRTGSSRNCRPMETSKTALREVAVEGAARAAARNGNSAGKIGGVSSMDDNDGAVKGELGDDEDERPSPQRPKKIDFSAANKEMAGASVAGGISNHRNSSSGSGSRKHVSFSPGTMNHSVDANAVTTPASANRAAADTAADKSALLATPALSAAAEVTTTSEEPNIATKATRRATPSPPRADGDVAATEEEAQDVAIAQEERYRRLREKIPPNMEWSLVWPTLKQHGWVYKKGQGLVSYYYCCSKYAHEKISYVVKHAVLGDEYFRSDEELQKFCRDKLGWIGGEGESQESRSKNMEENERSSRPKRASRQVVTRCSSITTAATSKPGARSRTKVSLAKSKTNGNNHEEDEIVCDNSRSGGSESSDSEFGLVELSPSTRRQRKNLIDASSADSTDKRTGPGGALCSPESYASACVPSKVAGVAAEANTPPMKKKRNTISTKKAQSTKAKKAPAAKTKKSTEAKVKKTSVTAGQKKTAQPKKGNQRARKPQTKMTSRGPTRARVSAPPSPEASTPASSQGSPKDARVMFSDMEAWRVILMRRFKFKYRGGFYCLPGVDPRSEDAIEGRDYFKLLTNLRRHLCAFGVPLHGITGKKRNSSKSRRSRIDASDDIDIGALLGDEDYGALNLWVRYVVVQSLRLENVVPSDIERIPEKRFMGKGGAWELLQKLGYKFSCGSYKLPHSRGDRAVSFDRAQDLCRHLARFGLTSSEAGALSSTEQLKLELFIAERSNVDTFEWIEPQDEDYHWLTQGTLNCSAPVAETSGTAQAEAGVTSPSSMKTLQAAEKSEVNGDSIDKSSDQTTPALPTEVALASPLSDTSALSATPMTSLSTNDIPEIDDSAAREAAEAVRLGRKDLTEDVNAVAPASVSDATRPGNDRKLGQDENEDEKQSQARATNDVQPDDVAEDETDILMHDEDSSDCHGALTAAEERRKRRASSEPAKPAAKPRKTNVAAKNSTGVKSRPNTRNDHSQSDLSHACNRKRKTSQIEADASTSNKSTQKNRSARSPNSSAVTNESPSAKESLPDMKRTVAEKLRCCQSVLHSDEVEDMFTNSPRVKQHVQAIRSFLERAMTAYGRGKGRFYPSSLYICGGPGTGKTTSLNMCIDTCSKDHSDARFLFRNVVSCGADGPSQAKRLLEDIKNKLRCSGEASYAKIEKALSCPPSRERRVAPFVLVLDEIDMLLSGGVRSDGKLFGGNKLIHTMLRWAADPNCAFSLIGVSNAVDDDRTRTLNALGDLHKILTFRPYKEEDLISILTARVGTQIIAEPALKMVSRKVAAGSGDARKALDMAAKAVRKCETDLSEEDLQKSGEDIVYPIVKLPHMMRSIREGMGMKHSESITALPQTAKIVLCVAVALSTVSPAWKVIKMKDLKKYCTEASRHGLMERINIEYLFDTVQMLSDAGLLLSGDDVDLRYAACGMDIHEIPLMLGVQLDDVEMALEKTLLTEQFYKSMVEYVKKHHRHPS